MRMRLLLLFVVTGLLLSVVNSAYAAPAASPSLQAQSRPAPGDPVRLVIPAIELDRRLLSVGLDRRRVPIVPNHDVGWYNLSARPGQGENVVLWGHVLRFRSRPNIPAPFARLHELKIGDRVTLYTADGTAHRYTVIEQVRVTPDQVEYILPRGKELVTMVSCIGDRVITRAGVEMTHRLITIAAPAR
ncbi:MAG: class F sortase [Oscillochloridaceae bacterium umkhey_bin13]